MTFNVEVKGVPELVADLKGLSTDLEDIPTMVDVSKAYANIASALAPRRTGALAASIKPTDDPNEAGAVATIKYAMFVNYGTKYMPGTHFMNKADQAMQAKTLDLIDQGVTQVIKDRGLDA